MSIVPGARYTWNERWGSFVAPRLALMVRPSGPLALRASVGRGFRAPDFKELYLNFVNAAVGYAVVGNPSLRPETSTSASLGAEWAGSRVYARASVFAARFRDFIETGSADATGTYTYENVATGSTGGVDVEAALTAGRWRFDAGYSYLRTRDGETRGPRLGRPPHAARASADMALGSRLHLSLGGQYTARTPDQRDSLGVVTGWRPDYLRFDLHTSVVLPGDFEITGGLDNVFNRRVGTAWPGYTGRQAFVGLTWRVGRS